VNGIRRSEPKLEASLAPFWKALQKVIDWSGSRVNRADLSNCLRSKHTRPNPLEGTRFGSVRDVVRAVRTGQPPRAPLESLEGGRLLVYVPDLDLRDGAAEAETDGFFDVYNAPPWDTWVAFVEDDIGFEYPYLVSWVPPSLIEIVARGIQVNPEECIRWLDDSPVGLRSLLREARAA
jgi:hypothetical protein